MATWPSFDFMDCCSGFGAMSNMRNTYELMSTYFWNNCHNIAKRIHWHVLLNTLFSKTKHQSKLICNGLNSESLILCGSTLRDIVCLQGLLSQSTQCEILHDIQHREHMKSFFFSHHLFLRTNIKTGSNRPTCILYIYMAPAHMYCTLPPSVLNSHSPPILWQSKDLNPEDPCTRRAKSIPDHEEKWTSSHQKVIDTPGLHSSLGTVSTIYFHVIIEVHPG